MNDDDNFNNNNLETKWGNKVKIGRIIKMNSSLNVFPFDFYFC